jgi:ferredoxin
MAPERIETLRKVAAMMNTRHKNPFPVTPELLRCFDVAMSTEEADFLLTLGTEPYTYEKAASLSPLPPAEFRVFFENMLRKGFIWPSETTDGNEMFVLPGIMLGWFEVYLSDGQETQDKREFARHLDALLKSFGKMNVFPTKHIFNYRTKHSQPHQSILAPKSPAESREGRKIVVGKAIDPQPAKVYPARNVEELLEQFGNEGDIAVVHCFCRQYHKMIDQSCRFNHPPESCIAIGSLSRYAVKYGAARPISKEEAISLVRELQARGAVHQVFHKDEDIGNPEIAICNCCWDCCGVFGSYNRAIIPLNLHAYFEAQLPDLSVCTGCETCVDYCPVRAITIVNDKCAIDASKCIGCGQCEIHCAEEAICLVPNERTVFLPLIQKSEARLSN